MTTILGISLAALVALFALLCSIIGWLILLCFVATFVLWLYSKA